MNTLSSEIAYVAVGSNIEPDRNVPLALERLADKTEILAVSTFYETEPLDRPDQSSYRNGVIKIRVDEAPTSLKFNTLRAIETGLGRERSGDALAPRTIDLDVILCGPLVTDEPGLRLPDPDIRSRPFIAVPLLEIAPDLILPDTGELLAELPVASDRASLRPDSKLTERLHQWIRSA